MAREYNSRNSTRVEDWSRFIVAVRALAGSIPKGTWDAFLEVLHTGKNIFTEEARRWGWETRPKAK